MIWPHHEDKQLEPNTSNHQIYTRKSDIELAFLDTIVCVDKDKTLYNTLYIKTAEKVMVPKYFTRLGTCTYCPKMHTTKSD